MSSGNGNVFVKLICTAKADEQNPFGYRFCGKTIHVGLYNDGQYTSFVTPEGWYVELGTNTTGFGATVRCPHHCQWVGSYPDPNTGEEIKAHWELDE